MFDTHAHLNFKAFKTNLDEVVASSKKAGVTHIVIPGTDVMTSKRAVEIAQKYDGLYPSNSLRMSSHSVVRLHAAVGIHPHHVFEKLNANGAKVSITEELLGIEKLLDRDKVVAVGEIGLDRHIYQKTKYEDYNIDESFIDLQKEFFVAQLALAKKYNKSVIVHNRGATQELLANLSKHWNPYFEGRMVFHCCEPDRDLLAFAKEHKIFIGVDGDVTYPPAIASGSGTSGQVGMTKQEFVKKVPLELLVLETDSPFLTPRLPSPARPLAKQSEAARGTGGQAEPLKSEKKFPNVPGNLPVIAEFVAKLRGQDTEEIARVTEENGRKLFTLTRSP